MKFCFLALLSLVLKPIYCISKCQSCWQLRPFRHFTDVTFTVDPVPINTTLNSTVIFTCEATATVSLTFRVDNKSASDEDFMGFTSSTSGSSNNRTGILHVIAYDFNNNTNISCRGSNDFPALNYSKPALLLIQGSECLFWQSYFSLLIYIGLLASVGNLTATYINESSVNLSWTAPYTLDNVPITEYYINDYSGRILNTTDLSYILSSPDPACDITTVTVSAVNGAGVGQPANTNFYYKRGILICFVFF